MGVVTGGRDVTDGLVGVVLVGEVDAPVTIEVDAVEVVETWEGEDAGRTVLVVGVGGAPQPTSTLKDERTNMKTTA
jgi:hypothetical protein